MGGVSRESWPMHRGPTDRTGRIADGQRASTGPVEHMKTDRQFQHRGRIPSDRVPGGEEGRPFPFVFGSLGPKRDVAVPDGLYDAQCQPAWRNRAEGRSGS
eukprot:801421-Heterocapsa_arctica.AAC.1